MMTRGFSNSVDVETPVAAGGREYRVLIDRARLPDAGVAVAVYRYDPGVQGPAHTHAAETEVYYCLRGSGTVRVGGEVFRLKPGTVVYIPPGIEHQTRSDHESELKFVAFFTPALEFGC